MMAKSFIIQRSQIRPPIHQSKASYLYWIDHHCGPCVSSLSLLCCTLGPSFSWIWLGRNSAPRGGVIAQKMWLKGFTNGKHRFARTSLVVGKKKGNCKTWNPPTLRLRKEEPWQDEATPAGSIIFPLTCFVFLWIPPLPNDRPVSR